MRSRLVTTLLIGLALIAGRGLLANEVLAEAKFGYEIPTDSTARKLYSNNVRYELEGSVEACKGFYGWASLGYFTSTGGTITQDNYHRIQIYTIGAGAKYLLPINERCDRVYLGVGILPTYVAVRETSIFLKHWTHDWAVGAVIKGGALINVWRCLFVDLFADYSFVRVEGKDYDEPLVYAERTRLDALTVGIGLGVQF